MTIPYDLPDVPALDMLPRTNAWRYQDWTVSADGYRLVIEGGAMAGLAYDEWPWPWGDARYHLYETVSAVVTDGREVWASEGWRQRVSP